MERKTASVADGIRLSLQSKAYCLESETDEPPHEAK